MTLTTKIERAIVTRLVSDLDAVGFIPVCVYTGEDYEPANTLETVLEHVFSVDESTIHFAPKSDPGKWGKFGVFCVCGNGADLISDYHCGNAEFSGAVEGASRMFDGPEDIYTAEGK